MAYLLKNVSEVLEKTINRNHKTLREAYKQVKSSSVESLVSCTDTNVKSNSIEQAKETNQDEFQEPTRSQLYHAERKALFDLVKELQQKGLNINQIRLQLKRHHCTVARFFRADSYPVTTRPKGSRLAGPFTDYLRQRWEEGCHNAKQLFRELQDKGYRGSDVTIRRQTQHWREPVPILIKSPPLKLPSPRSLVWLLLKSKEKLKDEEKNSPLKYCKAVLK